MSSMLDLLDERPYDLMSISNTNVLVRVKLAILKANQKL